MHNVHYMRNACQNLVWQPSKTQPGRPQNLAKSRPEASMRAKMHPRDAPDEPKGSQEDTRDGQGGIQERPRDAQESPRGRQERPRGAENSSKIEVGDSPGRNFSDLRAALPSCTFQMAAGSIFLCFLPGVQSGRHTFRIGLSNIKCLSGRVRIACVCARTSL